MTSETISADPDIATDETEPLSSRFNRQLLTFKCSGRGFAVDIMDVREIRSWSRPTPLPHAPPHMLGMVNLRGSVLPVTDLAQRLGQAPTEDRQRNVIIVIQKKDRVHGLLVDAVSDIVTPSPDQLQDVPPIVGGNAPALADFLFVIDEEMIQVLSMDSILPEEGGGVRDMNE
ncbi:chemotaxis protein CheW [Jannaschia pagri]|uniref:Chemotaxis protein CheW n=1 Tax=Jannaschia pagri TaxID=2829797 RepID=A0ABQ4NNE0_9RHOB|nr:MULTISPECIES: chemotaxis protein CheW [unclassified Jannaschia]GIT92063.1 chemotaxis protein CheW [Jannaschia sp. AI_61]GIT95898.1 chemotaxis protein CheW [Jannaschia sp. AI_62]